MPQPSDKNAGNAANARNLANQAGAAAGNTNEADPDDEREEGDEGNGQQNADAFVFDTWLTEQPANVKTGIESHVKGLKTALADHKARNKELSKQLADLKGKAEKG